MRGNRGFQCSTSAIESLVSFNKAYFSHAGGDLLKEAIPRQKKELRSWGEPGQAHGLIFLDSPAQQIGSQDTGDARFGDPFCWRWPQSIHPLFDWERGITNNKSSLQVNDWLVCDKLVVWNTNFLTFHILGIIIIPTDELIFFRGLKPPTRWFDDFFRLIFEATVGAPWRQDGQKRPKPGEVGSSVYGAMVWAMQRIIGDAFSIPSVDEQIFVCHGTCLHILSAFSHTLWHL